MAIFGKNKNNGKDANNTSGGANEGPVVNNEAKAEEKNTAEGTISEISSTETVAEKPKFSTPEGFDFNRYFLAERRIMLENVNYETTRPVQAQGQFKLGVKDTIVAQVLGQAGVKATYNRTLRFDPEGPFVLSVSFAVMLVFNPGTRGEIDWHTIDVAEEFKKNCPALIQQMSAKAALLVAEITAANGGVPIIPVK
ncbi:MAG: hypothetical protein ACI4XJ_06470 [Eubacteriales bacterium]